jgi:pantetheine-phosphate adenylyltransferase
MSTVAVVPGSFDPVTLGHLDVIERAARIFDEVHVLVTHNPEKSSALFTPAEREDLIREAIDSAGYSGHFVIANWGAGLLVDYCTRVGAAVLVKGVRSQVDVSYETPMAILNRSLAGVETVFLLPDLAHSHVSSTLVRQVNQLGGDVAPYVSPNVLEALHAKRG